MSVYYDALTSLAFKADAGLYQTKSYLAYQHGCRRRLLACAICPPQIMTIYLIVSSLANRLTGSIIL